MAMCVLTVDTPLRIGSHDLWLPQQNRSQWLWVWEVIWALLHPPHPQWLAKGISWPLFLYYFLHAESLQSYLTLCDPMDCSPPGSFVHGILQARTLEGVAMPSSRGSSQPRD